MKQNVLSNTAHALLLASCILPKSKDPVPCNFCIMNNVIINFSTKIIRKTFYFIFDEIGFCLLPNHFLLFSWTHCGIGFLCILWCFCLSLFIFIKRILISISSILSFLFVPSPDNLFPLYWSWPNFGSLFVALVILFRFSYIFSFFYIHSSVCVCSRFLV